MNGYGNSSYFGYDVGAIQKMFQGLSECYNDLITTVGNELQTQVIDPIGDFWYSKEAQETAQAVVDVINGEFSDAIRGTYDGIIGYLDGVAINWADLTHNDHVVNTYGNATGKFNVNRLTVKENLDGTFVGINENTAEAYTQGLLGVRDSITEKISETYTAIRGITPFVGGNQEAALQELFNHLNNSVVNMFAFIIDGTGELTNSDGKFRGMKAAIEGWTQEYKDRAERARSAITGENKA